MTEVEDVLRVWADALDEMRAIMTAELARPMAIDRFPVPTDEEAIEEQEIRESQKEDHEPVGNPTNHDWERR